MADFYDGQGHMNTSLNGQYEIWCTFPSKQLDSVSNHVRGPTCISHCLAISQKAFQHFHFQTKN